MSRKRVLKICAVAVFLLLSQTIPVTLAQNRVDPARVSVVYSEPGMEKRVVVRRGIVFDSTLRAAPLALDAYLPKGLRAGERRPAVIFVSGAERVREWNWFVTWGQLVAAHGIIGIVPDKRYQRGFDGLRAGFEDTEKLLAYLRTNGERLGIDPERLCIFTFSAGGRLTSTGLKADAMGVKCMVVFYGVLDLTEEFSVVADEKERESLLRKYSPLHVMESTIGSGGKIQPMLVARAGKDSPFINNGIDRFASTALRLNAPVTIVNYAEGDHGFDGLNDTPQSRAIIKATLQFIKDNTATR